LKKIYSYTSFDLYSIDENTLLTYDKAQDVYTLVNQFANEYGIEYEIPREFLPRKFSLWSKMNLMLFLASNKNNATPC